MEWYKLLGALLLSVSGGFGAYLANQRATATLRQTQAFEELLRYIRGQVDCFALPVSRILAECSPSLLLACGYRAEGVPEDLDTLLDGCVIRDEETARILESFARTFGKSYREEQTKGCYHRNSRTWTCAPGGKKR